MVKNAAYLVAMEVLQEDETIEKETDLRQSKYLNNMIEQDHRHIKRNKIPLNICLVP